ncbi:MAG: hypothetical protein RL189_3330 [Pseudomonadota bacterium]|jgi:1-acyl-sn-glycerol-3-phosphate acyltransferase
MLSSLKTLIFWMFFMISGVVMQLLLLLRLSLVSDKAQRQQLAQRFRLMWSALSLRLFFNTGSLNKLITHSEGLPSQFILISNHRSNLDPLLVSVIGRPLVFLSKKSVLKTPVIGWWMRLCGDVPVDRGEKSSRENSLNSMKERLGRGDSLLIFPEGTRQTDPTVPLGQFKDGAFHLSSQSGVPLVALVLDKTDDIWKKGSLTLNFRPLRFSISHAMQPQGRSVNELKEEAIQTMNAMVQTLTRQN